MGVDAVRLLRDFREATPGTEIYNLYASFKEASYLTFNLKENRYESG